MEREVGGGIGVGNTCKPLAVSFQCMTKSTPKKKKPKTINSTACHCAFRLVAYKGNREVKYSEERFSLEMATDVIRDLGCMKR